MPAKDGPGARRCLSHARQNAGDSTSHELVALHRDQLLIAATWAEIGPRGQNSSAVSRQSGSVPLTVNALADAVAVSWRDAY